MKKTQHKKQVADAISRKFERLKSKPPEQRTGAENLRALMGIETVVPVVQEQLAEEPEQKIVLYMREGVNPAFKNFTKYPNELHEIMNTRLKEMSAGIVYTYLWRQSWGYGRNYCRISYTTIVNNTLVKSRSTAQRAIRMLQETHFIVKGLLENDVPNVDQTGVLYRILTPSEVINGKTEEDVLLENIPIDGVLIIGIPTISIGKNGFVGQDKPVSNGNIENNKTSTDNRYTDREYTDNQYTDKRYTDSEHPPVPIIGIPMKGTPSHNSTIKPTISGYTDKRYTDSRYTFKEDNLKDSLSQEELISHFYDCIGQQKLTSIKRERARECLKQMLNEGFSLEDISFAIEWTIDNSKEKPYEFSIIQHTISQAMADKDKVETEKARRKEQEQIAIQEKADEDRLEKERAEIEAFKEKMEPEERERLRQKALEEINKMEGIKKDFITEVLIRAKENEILKIELDISKPSR